MALFTTMSIEVLYILGLHAVLIASEDLVDLEALCSSNRAGAKWTVISPTYNGAIDLDFSCTNENMTLSSDNCFHKRGGLPVLRQLQIPEPYSMTHVISTDLAPGTVCTFTANVLNRFQHQVETSTTSCTVGAPTAPAVLPAECIFANEQCQCSCSPGFEGIANNSIDGNACKEVANEVANITFTSKSILTIAPTSTIATPTFTNSSYLITTTDVTKPATASNFILPFAESATIITTSPTPTSVEILPQASILTTVILLPAIIIALLLIIVCLPLICFGRRKHRRERLHMMQAMPFTIQKSEKIDPDFNPIEIGKSTVVSESMHSIFNFLNPTGSDIQLPAIEGAQEFHGNNTATNDQEDTKCSCNNNEKNSGHVTECTRQDSLISEMTEYLDSPGYGSDNKKVSTHYWNTSDYVDDPSSQFSQPTDYTMPIFSRPHVYFSFPSDFLN
ncbi:uncharacterized protein LOC135331140 [Halichondria panicea]|uniref:uncharacterized protein LOC135331140 n=1 Tax=Halichondria panicea TaxID=6063 RepID=UPI00312BC232